MRRAGLCAREHHPHSFSDHRHGPHHIFVYHHILIHHTPSSSASSPLCDLCAPVCSQRRARTRRQQCSPSRVSVQMWQGASAVPEQMWQRWSTGWQTCGLSGATTRRPTPSRTAGAPSRRRRGRFSHYLAAPACGRFGIGSQGQLLGGDGRQCHRMKLAGDFTPALMEAISAEEARYAVRLHVAMPKRHDRAGADAGTCIARNGQQHAVVPKRSHPTAAERSGAAAERSGGRQPELQHAVRCMLQRVW
jgi:hypothetical protein